jgi:3-dehydroquinate dehydratase/shikimate dehydrogenase
MAVVVSHIASSWEALTAQALRQAPLADLIELRLDRIGNPGEERLAAFVRAAKKPVIVAVRGLSELGDEAVFAGGVAEALETLHAAARAGAMFVDVDWRLALELGPVAGKCHRIVSRHEPDTPEDLAAMEEEVREVLGEGDAVKLVAHANSTEDGLRMLRHLRVARGGLIAFASGARGSFTRLLCPIFGSAFTYAAPAVLPGGPEPEPTAPGQLRANELRGRMPPGGISPETAIFAVVGSRVAGSLSPWVHDMAFKAAHLDAVYVALETGDFERFLALADDQNFRGFSVTAPHKEAAYRAAHQRDEDAQAARAANTLVRDPRGWRAFNTDVTGVRETLERALAFVRGKSGAPRAAGGGPLAGVHALVLGAGGAARAVVRALTSGGGRVTLAARRAERAAALARELGCAAIPWEGIPELVHDVLVNATPVGSEEPEHAGRSPIDERWIRPGTIVLDAVYRPIKTPLLEAAHKKGCTAVPGAEWFVRQAAAQFKHFTQRDADEDLMRAAFENALAPPRAARGHGAS